MKVYDKKRNTIYVQKKDIVFIASQKNEKIPLRIIGSYLKNQKNQNDFLVFKDEKTIEFFQNIWYIPDYYDYKNQEEIEEEIKKAEKQIKEKDKEKSIYLIENLMFIEHIKLGKSKIKVPKKHKFFWGI